MNVMAWIRAARLPSHSYIALPLILGQAHAYFLTGEWDWTTFVLVELYAVFDQFYIVFANDYADYETDKDNQTSTIFSGGSRVLVNGELTPEALRKAAWVCVGGCLVVGAILSVRSIWILPLVAFGLLLLWMYSYPPIELSYRGGGELLQAVGVGAVLPAVGFAAQAQTLQGFPFWLLAFVIPLQYICAITTALPDEPSDKRGGKKTLPVLVGGEIARGLVLAFNILIAGLYTAVCFSPWVYVAWFAIVLQIFSIYGAKAGSWQINVFVFASILTNLAILAAEVIRVSL